MNPNESEHQPHRAETQPFALDFNKIAPPITPEAERILTPDKKTLGYLFNTLQIARHLFNSLKLGGEPREVIAESLEKRHLNLITDGQKRMGVKTNFDPMLNVLARINSEEAFQNPIDWNNEDPTAGVKETLDRIDAHLGAEHDDKHWDFLLATRPAALEGIGARRSFEQLYSDKLKGHQKSSVIYRVSDYTSRIQNLIEALTKEADLSQISLEELRAASDSFHENLKNLYLARGIKYQKVRLYEDSLSTPHLKQFITDSRATYKSDMSKALLAVFPDIPHGLIIRTERPVTIKLPTAGESPKWTGAVEYVGHS